MFGTPRFWFALLLCSALVGCRPTSLPANDPDAPFSPPTVARSVAPAPPEPITPVPPPDPAESKRLEDEITKLAAIPSPALPATSQKETGNGVVIFLPSCTEEPQFAAFGRGCGHWLHYNVGGINTLGRSPLLVYVRYAADEVGQKDLCLNATQGAKAAAILGATHYAVGELKGNAKDATLIYTLHTTKDGKPVGAPLRIRGSETEIVKALSATGKEIALRLGIANAPLPEPKETPDELRAGGKVEFNTHVYTPEGVENRMMIASAHSPTLASILLLTSKRVSEEEQLLLTRRMLAQSPDNAFTYGIPGYAELISGTPEREPGAKLALQKFKTYPHNSTLLRTALLVARGRGDIKQERLLGERLTKEEPTSSTAWIIRGKTLLRETIRVRYGRTTNPCVPH